MPGQVAGGTCGKCQDGVRRRSRRVGLRTRVTTSFAILSMLLSAFLAGTTYLLIQGSSLERRETLAKDAAFLNARAVRDELSLELSRQPTTGASGRPSIVDILPTAVGSVALLKFDQAWYVGDSVGKLSSGVGKLTRDDIPTAAEVELGRGQPVIMRYRLRGEPVLVVGVPMRVTPSSTISGGEPADYFEVSSLADLESTFETMVIALAGAGALTTVAGALLGRWASKRVLAPLADVSEAVEAIASSDLDTRLPRTNDPDLGPLIGSFNHMVATLQERIERDGRFASDVSHELRSPLTTLARFPRPTSGVIMSNVPRGVAIRAVVPSTPRSTMAEARTAAGRSMPNVTSRPANAAVLAMIRSSSALATSRVDPLAPSRISALASAVSSSEPKNSRCASPTFVHTRTSGSATRTSVLISPA